MALGEDWEPFMPECDHSHVVMKPHSGMLTILCDYCKQSKTHLFKDIPPALWDIYELDCGRALIEALTQTPHKS